MTAEPVVDFDVTVLDQWGGARVVRYTEPADDPLTAWTLATASMVTAPRPIEVRIDSRLMGDTPSGRVARYQREPDGAWRCLILDPHVPDALGACQTEGELVMVVCPACSDFVCIDHHATSDARGRVVHEACPPPPLRGGEEWDSQHVG